MKCSAGLSGPGDRISFHRNNVRFIHHKFSSDVTIYLILNQTENCKQSNQIHKPNSSVRKSNNKNKKNRTEFIEHYKNYNRN